MNTAPRSGGAPASLSPVVVRLALGAIGGALGAAVASAAQSREWLVGPNTGLYVAVLGALVAYLLSGAVAQRWADRVDAALARLGRVPPDVVLAAGTGATVALLVTVLINNVLATVPGFTWYWSLLIAVVLVAAASRYFVVHRKLFTVAVPRAAAEPASEDRGRDKIVDTSAIIDGRIADVVDTHFFDGTLLIPQFILGELQRIADSDDPLRRKRGRRGLEILDRLAAQSHVRTEVVSEDPGTGPVDDRLVALCLERRAALVTTDYNLSRVAALQGVRVLNVNQLANAMRASVLPGDRLSLTIVREGREAGQGVAYLEDGTMVVVEDAAAIVGRTVDVVVTSSLQTNMGRMIFARTAEGAPA